MRKPANITIVPKNVAFQRATSKRFIMNKPLKNLLIDLKCLKFNFEFESFAKNSKFCSLKSIYQKIFKRILLFHVNNCLIFLSIVYFKFKNFKIFLKILKTSLNSGLKIPSLLI